MSRSDWIIRRMLQLIPVLIGISLISFLLVQLTPGDPARMLLGPKASMEAVEAVREAVAARLRPIAMSTITTICGLAPLVLIPGAGTELYRGVGAIVMFGIIGAALVTLTMLPALTVFVLGWVERRTPRGAAQVPHSSAPTE